MRARTDGRHALLVGAGILLSRLVGLVRQRFIASYLGTTFAADALTAAFRAPNILQNLLGEGVLSASFIPVYARLLEDGEDEEASRVAGAIGALLAVTSAVVVVVGIIAAPLIVRVLLWGFTGERRELTIQLVRILFPGTALLVMSAWCIGILNSHHRFFLSYAAPVAWNLAIIGALLLFAGGRSLASIATLVAWAAVAGSALQLLVQWPTVRRVAPGLRFAFSTANARVRLIVRNFGPVVAGRGVVQVSGYADQLIASLLPVGAVFLLTNAQTLAMLPVSLFGMAVSAAELPAMSRATGTAGEIAGALRDRLAGGLARIAFFVVPSAAAFVAIGNVLAAMIFQSGRFTATDSRWIWTILGGSAIGLLASTSGRLYASVLYALQDTKTPFRFAVVRVALTISLGALGAIVLPARLGLDPMWGIAGLSSSAGLAAWVEFLLLRRAVEARIGTSRVPWQRMALLWAFAALAGAASFALSLRLAAVAPVQRGLLVVAMFGIVYLGLAMAVGVPEARALVRRVRRRRTS
jgi:putative peptidoglycan lipid II flippase